LKKNKILVLTGGIGNQLFQLAAGLTLSTPKELSIDATLGSPRLNSRGRPELDSFSFPDEIDFRVGKEQKRFFRILAAQAFKISSKRFKSQSYQRCWQSFKEKSSLFGVFLSDGVGFDPRINLQRRERWFFGPFHTYKYAAQPRINDFLKSMTLREYPEWLKKLRKEAELENPIVLHIRLSDYKNISELGILTKSYFLDTLSKAQKVFPSSRVWLFTDEEDLALSMLGKNTISQVRIINYELDNASANLEAMRFGRCYILSNSTFSWWGAFLSYSENPVIYCPESWFRTKQNPDQLLPDSWHKEVNS
jgi:hypothetical protein